MLFLVVALCCGKLNVDLSSFNRNTQVSNSAQSNAEEEESFSCTPKEKFDKDCHACTCSETGTYAICTGFICDPVNKSIRMKAPENCKDGDKWSDGCNDCICFSK